MGSTEVVLKTMKLIRQVRQGLQTTQSYQKSYVDKHRSELEFQVGDMVLLKVLPCKSVILFRNHNKLGPKFIEQFQVASRVSKVAYRLDLPEEISQIHNTFHVSKLQKCLVDDLAVDPLEDIQIDEHLNYVEQMIAILDLKMKNLCYKLVELVKVHW